MKYQIDYKDIVMSRKLIQLSCELFQIRLPEIYYVFYRKDTFRLLDENLQTISYDFRTIGFRIADFYFDKKNYGIYMNLDVFQNKLFGYVVVLRKIRTLYQMFQMQKLRKNQKVDEREGLIDMWKFAYQYCSKKYKNASPVEMDCNAYTSVIMNYIFNIDIKFRTLDENIYQEHLRRIKNRYSFQKVILLASKYNIDIQVARMFDLEDFQKDFKRNIEQDEY